MSISIFASIPLAPRFPGAMRMDIHRCLPMQWVTLWERNTDLRKHESFIRSGKHASPLLWRKTLSLPSKAVHYTNILKKSLEQMAISASLVRYVEIQETQGKWSLSKELPPTSSSSAWSLKRTTGTQSEYIFRKTGQRRICLMLGSPKAGFEMKIHMQMISQRNYPRTIQ